MESSKRLTRVDTTSCLERDGFSIVLITPSVFDATAIIFNSSAISSIFLDSTAESKSAFAYGLAKGVSSITAYNSSAAFFKISSCFSLEISSPRIF